MTVSPISRPLAASEKDVEAWEREMNRRLRGDPPGASYYEGRAEKWPTFVAAAGIMVTIICAAWKQSSDFSEFKGSILQWKEDTDRKINEWKLGTDRNIDELRQEIRTRTERGRR